MKLYYFFEQIVGGMSSLFKDPLQRAPQSTEHICAYYYELMIPKTRISDQISPIHAEKHS